MTAALKRCNTCNEDVWAQLRKLRCANGTFQLKFQCPKCGRSLSNALAQYGVEMESVAPWDDSFGLSQASRDLAITARRTEKSEEWWGLYRAYLKGAEWQTLRQRVLDRARYLCEGCGVCRATQVHHLTYRHVFSEFLFELVAICDQCHDSLHDDEKISEAG